MFYLWLQKFPEENKNWAPVKGGCFWTSLQVANRNNLVPGGQQHWSALEQRCLWRKALGGCEGRAFNLPARRFYLHDVIPSGHTIWAGFGLSYLRQRKALGKEPPRGIAVASAGEFCCPKGQDQLQGRDRQWMWAKVGREPGRSLVEPGWGEQDGKRASSSLLSITLASLGPLPIRGTDLLAVCCPQHSAATDKFCITCASILNAVWKEPAERWSFTFEVWSFTFEVWVSASPGSALVHSLIRALTFLAHSRLIEQKTPFLSLRLLSPVKDESLSSTFRSRVQSCFWCSLKRSRLWDRIPFPWALDTCLAWWRIMTWASF